MKANIINTSQLNWEVLAEARYYELYAETLRKESIIDSTIEAEINTAIDAVRNAVNESMLITALFRLNELKHMI